jgi:hypothetical protein
MGSTTSARAASNDIRRNGEDPGLLIFFDACRSLFQVPTPLVFDLAGERLGAGSSAFADALTVKKEIHGPHLTALVAEH